MDRETEKFQFLGFCGIYREAYKITFSRKILSQITMALILPLSFIFLAQIETSHFLFTNILRSEQNSPMDNDLVIHISSEWITLWLTKAAYILLILIVSLQSTSAMVYAVGCIYTAQEVTFKMVIAIIPKVWKRLLVTFLWYFIILGYNLVTLPIIVSIGLIIDQGPIFIPTVLILSILYFIGFVCINIVWYLASVVSVFEDMYGIRAILKSMKLIKGKMWVASGIFLKLHFFFFGIQLAFQKLVVHGETLGMINRVFYGIVCVVLCSILIHLGLVIQTVIYFICKSHHNEDVEKLCLADHLEVYRGEYLPLKGYDVQSEQSEQSYV